MLAAVPRALVERFFLAPDKIMHVRVRLQRFLYRLMRERIELLYTHDSDIFLVVLTALFQQIVINLTRAQDNTLHRFRVEIIDFTDGRQEGAVRQFVQAGDRQRMTQQRFRRHHHQRTTHTAQRLTTQHVVNLSRS